MFLLKEFNFETESIFSSICWFSLTQFKINLKMNFHSQCGPEFEIHFLTAHITIAYNTTRALMEAGALMADS